MIRNEPGPETGEVVEGEPKENHRSANGRPPTRSKAKSGGGPRPFPAWTLEESLVIPNVIKNLNGGNPWPPAEVAKALKLGAKGDKMWYLSASARDYGLTVGTRETTLIELAPIGRKIVYAVSPESEQEGLRDAFFCVDAFKRVFEYYKGASLPDLKYLSNTLESVFVIPPAYHEEFVKIYSANLEFLNRQNAGLTQSVAATPSGAVPSIHSIVIGEPRAKSALLTFVIMPFVEKTERYSKGFFDEVLKNLITPAAIEAGFKVETAKREGSDVIHSTIVNDLLAADLVVADLTEHNPNVLFELGLRMATEKPTALIRARGTAPIFDVDNLLRVYDYDPNLWKSTLEADLPRLVNHLKGTWDGRDSATTYMQLLKRR